MKNQLWIMFIALTICIGCGKSDPPLSINQTEVTLRYQEEFLFAIKNAVIVEWTSSDEFVGKIESDGTFKARHIGETTITGKSQGKTFTAHIVVEPTITGVAEPFLQFGKRKPDIKDFEMRQLADETPQTLFYTEPSTYTWGARYIFEDDLLAKVDLLWNFSKIEESAIFYAERYELVSTSNNITYFRDRSGGTVVQLTSDSSLGVTASYSANSTTD